MFMNFIWRRYYKIWSVQAELAPPSTSLQQAQDRQDKTEAKLLDSKISYGYCSYLKTPKDKDSYTTVEKNSDVLSELSNKIRELHRFVDQVYLGKNPCSPIAIL
jgi:hypothetical protein